MSGTKTPEHIREQARVLHAKGLRLWEIERETGLSINTIKRVVDPAWADHVRALDREWKRNHRPYCSNCGDPCSGRYCQRCYALKRTVGEHAGSIPNQVIDFVEKNGGASSQQIGEALSLDTRILYNTTYRLVKAGRLKSLKRGMFTV